MNRGKSMDMKWKALSLGFLMLFGGMAYADEKDQIQDLELRKASLRKDLVEIDKKLLANDSVMKMELERFNLISERYTKDLENRSKEMQNIAQKLTELKNSLRNETVKQSNIKSKSEQIENKREYLAQQLIESCRKLEKVLEKTLPWDRESRLGRVAALRRDLETGNASLEEGFGRLKAVAEEEIKWGDEVAIQTQPISRNDGTIVNATLLRIGNQWMVYVDDEEKNYGILQPKGEGQFEWFEDLNFAQREAVRNAIAVKLAKKPPQVIKLPLEIQGKGASQ